MRETFLVFLLVIAVGLIATWVAFAWWCLRAVSDDEEAGCGLWLLIIVSAVFAFGIAGTILTAVGHAVGIHLPSLLGG